MRVAVIGAGSGYMPGVIRGVLHRAGDLAGTELACHDVDAGHLEIMTRLARRMFSAAGAAVTVSAHTDLKAAVDGASYVFTTFRPGGLAARHLDESIPLKYGVVGQETAGPGGFLMALPLGPGPAGDRVPHGPGRLDRQLHQPDEHRHRRRARTDRRAHHRTVRPAIGDTEMWAELLGLPFDGLEADWAGLNHATWAQRLRLDGQRLDLPPCWTTWRSPAAARRRGATRPAWPSSPTTLGLLPNSYAKYYFFHDEVVRGAAPQGHDPRQDVLGHAARLLRAASPPRPTRPTPTPAAKRGGGEHGEFAVDVICALHRDEGRRMIVNTRNGGATPSLDPTRSSRSPRWSARSGPVPLTMGPLPAPVRGLTQAIQPTSGSPSDAAVTGDRRTALQALMAHPFVRSKHTAERSSTRASPRTATTSPSSPDLTPGVLNRTARRPYWLAWAMDCGEYRIGLGVYALGRLRPRRGARAVGDLRAARPAGRAGSCAASPSRLRPQRPARGPGRPGCARPARAHDKAPARRPRTGASCHWLTRRLRLRPTAPRR